MKFSVFVATSLDGFIARSNGDLDWLPQPSRSPEPGPIEDYGYADFMSSINTVIVGRRTYEKVLTFGEWPYDGKRVIVLTRSLTESDIPEALRGKLEISQLPIAGLAISLRKSGSGDVYVDGGKTIQGFLSAGLIDELTITTVPVLIGNGIPLFGKPDKDIRLGFVRSKAYKSGLMQSTYRVKK